MLKKSFSAGDKQALVRQIHSVNCQSSGLNTINEPQSVCFSCACREVNPPEPLKMKEVPSLEWR